MSIARIKRYVATRIYRWLSYWAVDSESTSTATVARYRARGMRIGRNVLIYSSNLDGLYPELISIGDDVTITHAVVLTHDDATVSFGRRRRIAPVYIGNRVFVGHHSLILPGITVGDDCIIGAGAVVTRNVPAGSIVAGNPARILRSTESYVQKMADDPFLIDVVVQSTVLTPQEEQQIKQRAHAKYRPDWQGS